MRIRSNYHDFYDKGQTSLPDSLIYVRMKEEVYIDGKTVKINFPPFQIFDYSDSPFSFECKVVGFCG